MGKRRIVFGIKSANKTGGGRVLSWKAQGREMERETRARTRHDRSMFVSAESELLTRINTITHGNKITKEETHLWNLRQ
jgi:hypothetical protein